MDPLTAFPFFLPVMLGTIFLVSGGLAITTNLVSGIGGTVPKYIGWGTGAVTPTKTSSDVSTAATEARATGTPTRQQTTYANDTLRVVGTLTADGGKTITNVGLFDAAGSGSPPSGGNLFALSDHTGVVLAQNDQITYTWNICYT